MQLQVEQLRLTRVRPRTVSLEQTPENATTVDSSVGVIQLVNVTVLIHYMFRLTLNVHSWCTIHSIYHYMHI